MYRFEATVERAGNGGAWLLVRIPPAVSDALGARNRVPVAGRVNGFAFKSSLFPNEGGAHHLMFGRALQLGAKAGVRAVVRVELEAT
jgi:hypothetical protein